MDLVADVAQRQLRTCHASTWLCVTKPAASSLLLYSCSTVGCCSMQVYASGCAAFGSSSSLCPCLHAPTEHAAKCDV